MPALNEVCARIAPVDREAAQQAQRLLDVKTKPRRSLGRLEDLACQLAAVQRTPTPRVGDKAIVVLGADHGVAESGGVSAYPQAVTAQMLANFANGGAAINVLARQAGARVVVVDMGVRGPLAPHPRIRALRIGDGTRDFTVGPAMQQEQAVRAIEAGMQVAFEVIQQGATLIGIGEMGIGNTTAASALTAALTGASPIEVTGRGTGVDDAGLARKRAAIERALQVNAPNPRDVLDTMSKLGGFELAGLCGVVLAAAAAGVAVIMDGFIASTAALCAVRLVRDVEGYLIASHRSVEPGHRHVLAALRAQPLLDLELRLGEGTGAALAMGVVQSAVAILHEMATFDAAGVSDSGA